MKKSLLTKLAETYLAHQAEAQAEPRHTEPVRPSHFARWLPNVLVSAFVSVAAIGGTAVARTGLFAPTAPAASNNTFAYQGRIANAAGAPLSGVFPMSFRLYSQAIAGVPLWSEDWIASNSVRVSDGLFNVMLGSLVAIPNTIVANNVLWLGVSVGGDSEMSPRVQLGTVPFSLQALTVPDASITTNKIVDGSVTKAKLASDVDLVSGLQVLTTVTAQHDYQLPLCNSAFESIPGLSVTVAISRASNVLIDFAGLGRNSVPNSSTFTAIFVDGTVDALADGQPHFGGSQSGASGSLWFGLSNTSAKLLNAGTHQIEVKGFCSGNGIINSGKLRVVVISS